MAVAHTFCHPDMASSSAKNAAKRARKNKKAKGAAPHASSAGGAGASAGKLPVPVNLLTAGAPLDADVEIERQGRMEALKAELLAQIAAGKGAAAIDQLLTGMMQLERDNERLAWRVLRANRFRFGRSSEKLSREQLGQLLLALGGEHAQLNNPHPLTPTPEAPEVVEGQVSAVDSDDDSDESADEQPPPKKKRRRVERMTVDDSVERNVTEVLLSEQDKQCQLCGEKMKVFGHVEHETIRFVPAKIAVDIERREKAGCQGCRQDIVVADRKAEPAVVRKVDASLLAKLIADKTALALPVDRQRRQLLGMGLTIPAKTLDSYWAYSLDLLQPVADATLSGVFGEEVVGLDDSHLKTLDPARLKDGKKGVFRGHLWCFVGTDSRRDGPERVGYGYAPTWKAVEILDWVNAIDGWFQCDGYAGYSAEREDEETGETQLIIPDERRLGCCMHARSKFHDALLAKDPRAAVPMKYFAELYEIEADCKKRGLDSTARGAERQARSWTLLDALDAWVDDIHPKLLPQSPLRRATTYAINQRQYIRRCFQDGRFEIDQGRVERRIRNFAVGRRNYLFTGSIRAGHRLAAAYTLVDNCTILGIDPFLYLLDVIGKLEGGWPMSKLSECIPWNWARLHQA